MISATKPRFFRTQAQFRNWLKANHGSTHELLVGFYRRGAAEEGITYPEALDEALCFGWIDGVRRRYDDTSYTIRFTPRKSGSIWSAVNLKRAKQLTELGRMHPAGQKVFRDRDRKKARMYSYERKNCNLDISFEEEFRAHKKAWDFYQAQPPWYRRTSNWWVMSAKQDSTRRRRLKQLIADSSGGLRIKQLRSTPKS